MCNRCDSEVQDYSPDKTEIKCFSCKKYVRVTDLKTSRVINLSFQKNEDEICMYQPQVEEYLIKFDLNPSISEKLLMKSLLNDKETELIVDRFNVCV